MRKILPVLFLLLGTAAGVGAGVVLGSGQEDKADAAHPEDHDAADVSHDEYGDTAYEQHEPGQPPEGDEYVKLNNQFVVSVVEDGDVAALVVMSLFLQIDAGNTELTYRHEPMIRDALLQALFDHANTGGFTGEYTGAHQMKILRESLQHAAQTVLGDVVNDVLIQDLVRQDI